MSEPLAVHRGDYRPIPVTLLTGFLGSGKTTLLNRLLADPEGMRAAVLVNEFGEVGLDHLLARPVEGTKVVVQNGCVCCTMHEDLRTTLRDLLNARARREVPAFDRLLVETSGVSDPMPVILTLHGDPMFRHRLKLESIVTTVDALSGVEQARSRPAAARQVSMADHVVITKTDLQEAREIARLESGISALAPEAQVHRVPGARSLWQALMAPVEARLDFRSNRSPAHLDGGPLKTAPLHRHGTGLNSFALMFEERPDWSRFAVWLSLLMHRYGPQLLRIKGLLDVEGQTGPMTLDAVQNYIHPPGHLEEWPDDDHRSRLVFITEGLDEAVVHEALCQVLGITASPVPDVPKRQQG